MLNCLGTGLDWLRNQVCRLRHNTIIRTNISLDIALPRSGQPSDQPLTITTIAVAGAWPSGFRHWGVVMVTAVCRSDPNAIDIMNACGAVFTERGGLHRSPLFRGRGGRKRDTDVVLSSSGALEQWPR